MPLLSLLAVYLLFWSLTLFVVLPWKVRTGAEEGAEPVKGAADSAPHDPRILWKLKWTTFISAALFAIFYANYVAGWLKLADFPWMHRGPA